VKRIALVETLTVDNGTAANSVTQRYQLSNNIESATLELNELAEIISYEEYYPYGDTSYQAGKSAAEVGLKRYRYTGKEKDEESGLYYMLARYYSGWLGRWAAADPAGLVDGMNLYMYCRGNPVILLDPEGRNCYEEHWTEVNEEGTTILYGRKGCVTGSFDGGDEEENSATMDASSDTDETAEGDISPSNNLGSETSLLQGISNSIYSWLKKAAALNCEISDKIISGTKKAIAWVYEKTLGGVVSDIASDIKNFNWSNENEEATLKSNYFSAYKGQLVIRVPFIGDSMSWGIMFLGKNLSEEDVDVVEHEWGHFKQMKELGFLVYSVGIGVPSLTSATISKITGNYDGYFNQKWEISADIRGGAVRSEHTQEAEKEGEEYMSRLKSISTILGIIFSMLSIGPVQKRSNYNETR
jgi:RHS repeat-associated protein